MIDGITGIHHVTMMASTAARNDRFFSNVLGLRRVKKTVNFDQPDVYHLYFGDAHGSPGTILTSFPFGNIPRGQIGTGEAALTVFSVPVGAIKIWQQRLERQNVAIVARTISHGANRLVFEGPDGEMLALEEADDQRQPYVGAGLSAGTAVRGLRSVTLRIREQEKGGLSALLELMGYGQQEFEDDTQRFALPSGGPASMVDVQSIDEGPAARLGAGSVHHVAFSVRDSAAQWAARDELEREGYSVTPVIDRDYFHAIYFRTPGGLLFEIATEDPGFAVDEDIAHLGESLCLPAQHEHHREELERTLEPLR